VKSEDGAVYTLLELILLKNLSCGVVDKGGDGAV